MRCIERPRRSDGVGLARTVGGSLEKALVAKRESKYVDFKERFDPEADGEWLELLKDLVAMANSGGGAIAIGIRNNGQASGADVRSTLDLDAAKISDKTFRYTGDHFSGFEMHDAKRRGKRVAVIEVAAVDIPLVFIRPGTYAISASQQKTAFSQGTVYFRHGAKSEPATSADLATFLERSLDQIRKKWLGDIRRVVTAPRGAEVAVFQRTASDSEGRPVKVQFTSDPGAPVFGKLDADVTHPHRQKELIQEVRKRLPQGVTFNSFDIQSVRAVHKVDDQTKPEFCHLPKFGTMQYSDALADWFAEQYTRNNGFFEDARVRHYEQSKRRNSQ